MLNIDMEEFANRLAEKQIDEETIKIVLYEMVHGLKIDVVPENSFKIDGGNDITITVLKNNEKSPLLTCYFDADIDGIDKSKIISVKVPKFDIRDVKRLTLEVEVSPFKT